MDINQLYNQNQNIYQSNSYIDYDNEIYTIKDSNLKKITNIIREVQNGIGIEKPLLNIDKKENNQKLYESTKKVNELYSLIFNIKELRKKYEKQKEIKYQQFKKFIKNKNEKDILQKIIDNSLIENLKKLKEENKEEKEKIDKKEETIDSEKAQQIIE